MEHGHRPAIAANYGLQAAPAMFDGVLHYPMGIEAYSNDVIGAIFRDWSMKNRDAKPLCVALFDAWPLVGPAWDRMPVGIWTMVDHLPVPPAVLDFLRKPNVTPLAASMFAHNQIERAGVESIYVPMAIDTDLYRPTATWNNGEADLTGRELMGFKDPGDEDLFVVSLVNANKSFSPGAPQRKAWAENLLACAAFMARHDDVRIYIHTERNGKFNGLPFDALLSSLEIAPDRFRFVNQWAYMVSGIPDEAMAAIYSASDVLLAATYGEGFGLTVAEAGACETPAIVSDFTCQPELVSDDSFLVGGQVWWDGAQAAWWQVPNVAQIVEALEAAYARGRYRSPAQREHILANFDADTVFRERWLPALERLTAEPSAAVEPLPAKPGARLTIYVPTYKRASLADTLASLDGQLDDRVELIVADNDPDASAREVAEAYGATYVHHGTNLGGEENLLRGLESGSAPWVWMIGDDDTVLPGAVAAVLDAIEHDDLDRLVLLSREAPSGAAGMIGTPAELEAAQPGMTIAATLISANVVRRSSLDIPAGRAKAGTMYAWAFALAGCRRVKVLASPAISVGADHAGEFLAGEGFTGDIGAVWADLLAAHGVTPHDGAFSWNYASVA